MLKLNEKNIGKFNLVATFFVVVIFSIAIATLILIAREDTSLIFERMVKEQFISEKKSDIKFKVHNINQLIMETQKETIKRLKNIIKLRVNNSHKIIEKIYTMNKDTKSKEEIIHIIKETLRPLRFDSGVGYIFMVNLDGTELLFPVAPQYENTNVLNLKDANGNDVIKDEINIVNEKGAGYIRDFWTKPYSDNKDMIYPKITYVKGFKELNIYIGTGMYIDDARKVDQEYIQSLVTSLNKQTPKEYIIISKLLDINGGDAFAKILVHPLADIGKIIGDNKKDLYGKYYRKEYLKRLKKSSETYLKYSYMHPIKKSEVSKISYFKLNKDWNWIIGSGFHDDSINEQILTWKERLNELTKNKLIMLIGLLVLFSTILIYLVYYINKITNNIIKRYKNDVELSQNALNDLNNDLEVRIEEEVTKSQNQEKLLSEQSKNAALGEMIGNIAHQWRQPLSVITTTATGMRLHKELGISNGEEEIAKLISINDTAQHLSKTIDDFRDFLKGDHAKASFNVNNALDRTIVIEDSIIKNNGITLIQDFNTDIKIVNLENGLMQSLVNIINNSKDALEELEENKRFIFFSSKIKDTNVIITVKDTANGIPTEILPKIFEPYFTTKHQSQGTGLGLHMTYNLITKNMLGTIDAKNVTFDYEGNTYTGALFTLTIPID